MKVTENMLDRVFHALSHASRRRIVDLIKASPGCCVNDLVQHFGTSRISVMKHLRVLVEANLVISRKKGRSRELFFNVVPIQLVYDRWGDEYSAFWAAQVVDLKYKVESKSRRKTSSRKKAKS